MKRVGFIIFLVWSLSTIRALRSIKSDDSRSINPDGCGLRYKDMQSRTERFLSNKRSNQKDWAWLAILVDKDNLSNGGSLINSQWIMTSARFAE